MLRDDQFTGAISGTIGDQVVNGKSEVIEKVGVSDGDRTHDFKRHDQPGTGSATSGRF
jgi:hypothetical protein